MKDKNENTVREGSRTAGYAAFGLAIAAAVSAALMFVTGIYGLLASAVCSLAALAFCNAQKKKSDFALVKAARITAYCALILSVVVLIGGIVYSAVVPE